MTKHTKPWKEAQAKELKLLAEKYHVVAVAPLKNFPGVLAKDLRKKLQGKAVVKVSKTRVVALALKGTKSGLGLDPHLKGSVAVIFSELNPFELFSLLKKNSVSMPAKEGMVAPDNIVVPAGDTGLPPGPALSDLKAAGLKTVMQGPTISIAEDKVVSKKGELITAGVSGALSKLGIKPIKVSLRASACVEKGQVFLADVLDIDIGKVRRQFAECARNAFNIAVEIAYVTKETAPALVGKAFRAAKAVAIEANFLTPETTAEILAKASRQASALKAKIPDSAHEEKATGEKSGATAGGKADEAQAKQAGAEEKSAAEKKDG